MFKTRVLAQRILLSIFFVISNVENHEKIAFMKIKKKCRAGAKCRARWDQNHLIFFYLALTAFKKPVSKLHYSGWCSWYQILVFV